MGDYTELYLEANLIDDTPDEVIQTLRCFAGEIGVHQSRHRPDNDSSSMTGALFNWSSAYFDEPSGGYIRKESGKWKLYCRYNLKNYDGEHDSFLEWIAPYIDNGDVVGYTWFGGEGWRKNLFMFNNGKVIYVDQENPRDLIY